MPTMPNMPTPKVEQTMMSIKELKDSYYAEVDWLTLISSLMFKSKSKTVINEDQLIVTNPTYITKFKELMVKTPSKTIANLIGFNILSHIIKSDASGSFNGALKILSKLEAGSVDLEDCIPFLSSATVFYKASVALYARKYFRPEQKTMTEDLLNISLNEMKLLLEDIQWMDKTTKTKAIRKVDSMLSNIGYNIEILNKTQMLAYHDSFLESMNSKSFINNQVTFFSQKVKASIFVSTIYQKKGILNPLCPRGCPTNSVMIH